MGDFLTVVKHYVAEPDIRANVCFIRPHILRDTFRCGTVLDKHEILTNKVSDLHLLKLTLLQ